MRCRDIDHLVLCMPTPQEPTPADGLAEDILTHLASKNQSPCPVAGLGTRRLRGWGYRLLYHGTEDGTSFPVGTGLCGVSPGETDVQKMPHLIGCIDGETRPGGPLLGF